MLSQFINHIWVKSSSWIEQKIVVDDLTTFDISENGEVFAIGFLQKCVLWQLKKGEWHRQEILAEAPNVALSPNGQYLALIYNVNGRSSYTTEQYVCRIWQYTNDSWQEYASIVHPFVCLAVALTFDERQSLLKVFVGSGCNIYHWEIHQGDVKLSAILGDRRFLYAKDASIRGVKDFSVNNKTVLMQRGAVETIEYDVKHDVNQFLDEPPLLEKDTKQSSNQPESFSYVNSALTFFKKRPYLAATTLLTTAVVGYQLYKSLGSQDNN